MRRFRSRSRRTPDAVRPRGGRPVRRTLHVAGRTDHRLPRPGGRRARTGCVAGDRGALRSLGTATDRDPPVALRHPRRAGDPRDGRRSTSRTARPPPRRSCCSRIGCRPRSAGRPGWWSRASRLAAPSGSRTPSCRRRGVGTSWGRCRSTCPIPFALVRQRLEFDEREEELIVTPEIEDLTGTPDAAFGANVGASRTRNLFRTGEEYYTMRQYHEGDDLRRIHWPSVARTGELMIRQDESSRRANGLVFLDSREGMLGPRTGRRSSGRSRSRPRWGSCSRAAGSRSGSPRPTRRRPRCRRSGSSRHSRGSRTPRYAVRRSRARPPARIGASADTSLVFVSGLPRPSSCPP